MKPQMMNRAANEEICPNGDAKIKNRKIIINKKHFFLKDRVSGVAAV